jgi:hypothetical protein
MPAAHIRLQSTALWRVATVALGAALATAACTASTPAPAPAPEPTRTGAPPSPAVISPSPASPAQQALAAYAAMWADVQAVGETSDYQDPRLAAHLAGQALLTTSENMAVDKADGIIGLGWPELSGTSVVTATATTVTLHGCMSDEHWLKYYAATHTLVDAVPGGRHYVAATLTDENGTWKVTTLDVRGVATCS